MGTTNISFRTAESTRDELDQIATSLGRDRTWVINDAIESYIEFRRWQQAEIEKGIADSDAGRVLTVEQVRERLAQFHAETKSRESTVTQLPARLR